MRRRIENRVVITCEDVDLTTLSELEFYVKQGYLFFQYTPEVVSASEMVVTVPLEDAMKLSRQPVQLQFAYLDEDGHPDASNVVTCDVGELLKEAGYNGD